MDDDSKLGENVGGIDRRTMLKRSAVVGGALVWTAPVVQSIASPAFAAESPVVIGCINPRLVAVKFDEEGQDGVNDNQCLPGDATEDTPEGQLLGPAILNNTVNGDELQFTLGAGDTFIAICAVGGNGELALTEISRTTNADGSTTFVFRSDVDDPDISNFSVLFGDCP